MRGRECSAWNRGWFLGRDSQQGFHFVAVGNFAIADALVVVAQNAGRTLHLRRVTFNFEVVVVQMGANVQRGLEQLQVFVKRAKKFVDAPGNADGLLHQACVPHFPGMSTRFCISISLARAVGTVKPRPCRRL